MGNRIGIEGMKYLSDALIKNSTVISLKLSKYMNYVEYSHIKLKGIEYLCNMLKKNTSLKVLNLSIKKS